ncbi:MAG: polyprenyl synthetase family protein [Proteobacteria bacterium]|nr:polyprenyl synthetase family protein [Pseudomonadota bacterium]
MVHNSEERGVQGHSPLLTLSNILKPQMEMVDGLMRSAALSDYAELIPKVINHIIGAGGKRVRPMMTIAAARMCGIVKEKEVNAIRLAASVEYIHTATLLHDDVIDEGVTRRNIPTANRIWGNKASILVGDYMFSQAFSFMVEAGSMQALAVLSHVSAVISESEVLQLQLIGDINIPEADYLQLIDAKTASLFAAATEVGAISAGASASKRLQMRRYGWLFGMIFQITDDLLDYFARHEKFGKSIGGDFYEGKVTCVILILKSLITTEQRKWLFSVFNGSERTPEMLDELQALLLEYKVEEKAREMARAYIAEGQKIIAELGDSSDISHIMSELLVSTANREY